MLRHGASGAMLGGGFVAVDGDQVAMSGGARMGCRCGGGRSFGGFVFWVVLVRFWSFEWDLRCTVYVLLFVSGPIATADALVRG